MLFDFLELIFLLALFAVGLICVVFIAGIPPAIIGATVAKMLGVGGL